MDKKTINSSFLDKYFSYLTFLQSHIDKNDNDFKVFIKKNNSMKKVNPKMFIKTWYQYITIPYHTYIINMDEDYFINKDYDCDSSQIAYITNKCKNVYNKLSDEDKNELWTHIINLSQLSTLYFQKISI